MIDIDHFKAINDRHGHAAGDAVLAGGRRAMRGRLRAEDQLGRLGGEEFLALLPDAAATQAAVIAEELRAEVAGGEPGGARRHDQRRLGGLGRRGRPTSCCAGPTTRCTRPRRAGRDRVHGAPATVPRRT